MSSKSSFDPDQHHRRSIRLKGYDYSKKGLYFITLSCKDRVALFGQVHDGVMNLNDLGKIVVKEWLRTTEIRSYVSLHDYVIMPDHFHAIVEILHSSTDVGLYREEISFKSPKHTIGSIVRGFKSASTTRIRTYLTENTGYVVGANPVGANSYSPLPRDPISPLKDPISTLPRGSISPQHEKHISPMVLPHKDSIPNKIWQRNYFEKIIWNEESYHEFSDYIRKNPERWWLSKLGVNEW